MECRRRGLGRSVADRSERLRVPVRSESERLAQRSVVREFRVRAAVGIARIDARRRLHGDDGDSAQRSARGKVGDVARAVHSLRARNGGAERVVVPAGPIECRRCLAFRFTRRDGQRGRGAATEAARRHLWFGDAGERRRRRVDDADGRGHLRSNHGNERVFCDVPPGFFQRRTRSAVDLAERVSAHVQRSAAVLHTGCIVLQSIQLRCLSGLSHDSVYAGDPDVCRRLRGRGQARQLWLRRVRCRGRRPRR